MTGGQNQRRIPTSKNSTCSSKVLTLKVQESFESSRLVRLRREFHVWDEILQIQGSDADVQLICKDGIVRADAFILQYASSFIDELFESQGVNYVDFRKIIMPDFMVIHVYKTIQLVYTGSTEVTNAAEADFILEILDALKIDRKQISLQSTTLEIPMNVNNSIRTSCAQSPLMKVENASANCNQIGNLNLKISNVRGAVVAPAAATTITAIPFYKPICFPQIEKITKSKPSVVETDDDEESSLSSSSSSQSESEILSNVSAEPFSKTLRSREKRKRVNYADPESDESVTGDEEETHRPSNALLPQGPRATVMGKRIRKKCEGKTKGQDTNTSKIKIEIKSDDEEYSVQQSTPSSGFDSDSDSDDDPEYKIPVSEKLISPQAPSRMPSQDFLESDRDRLRESNGILNSLYELMKIPKTANTKNCTGNVTPNLNTGLPSTAYLKFLNKNHLNSQQNGGNLSRVPGTNPNASTSATALLKSLSNQIRMSKRISASSTTQADNLQQVSPRLLLTSRTITPGIPSDSHSILPNVDDNDDVGVESKTEDSLHSLVPITISMGSVFGASCESRYKDVNLYREDAKICNKCNTKYPDLKQAVDCIRNHKLVRCYYCFALFPSTEILLDHYKRSHSSSKCPVCLESVVFDHASMHAISKHLFTTTNLKNWKCNKNVPASDKLCNQKRNANQIQKFEESKLYQFEQQEVFKEDEEIEMETSSLSQTMTDTLNLLEPVEIKQETDILELEQEDTEAFPQDPNGGWN